MTPKILAYLSIIIWTIVLSVTILMIIFPKLFLKIDERLQLKKPRTPWKERFALRINHAISPLTVSIFYAIIGVILALAGQRHILGIVFCSMISASIGFRAVSSLSYSFYDDDTGRSVANLYIGGKQDANFMRITPFHENPKIRGNDAIPDIGASNLRTLAIIWVTNDKWIDWV